MFVGVRMLTVGSALFVTKIFADTAGLALLVTVNFQIPATAFVQRSVNDRFVEETLPKIFVSHSRNWTFVIRPPVLVTVKRIFVGVIMKFSVFVGETKERLPG